MGVAGDRVIYIIVCAAPPAGEVQVLVKLARDQGWVTHVIATPDAIPWLEIDTLMEISGHPIRSEYRLPGEGKSLPPADAIVVAPATFNTVNKFRHGIADNLAVGILCECLRAKVPIVVAPNVKAVLAEHPAFSESLKQLRTWGVHVMEQRSEPGGARLPAWKSILDTAKRVAG